MRKQTGKVLATLLVAGFASTANAEIASKAYVDAETAAGKTAATTIGTFGDVVTHDASEFEAAGAAAAATTDMATQTWVEGKDYVSNDDITTMGLATAESVNQVNTALQNLGSAANAETTDFATAAQGAKADTAVQSVSAATGAANGQIAVTVDGVTTQANVKGLGSAAYTASTAYDAAGAATTAVAALEGTLGALAKAAPGACSNATNKCLLTFDGTNYGWEVIARDTLGN